MSKVYWDSMVFIYELEQNPNYFLLVESILEGMHRRRDALYTSVFTIGEVLVLPKRLGSVSSADRAKAYFASGAVTVLPFTMDTADKFADIRAWTRVGSPDAVHLATASLEQVDLFVTNDKRLLSLTVPGIRSFLNLDATKIGNFFP